MKEWGLNSQWTRYPIVIGPLLGVGLAHQPCLIPRFFAVYPTFFRIILEKDQFAQVVKPVYMHTENIVVIIPNMIAKIMNIMQEDKTCLL